MIEIKYVYPEIDGGKYPVKTEVDRIFSVKTKVISPSGSSVFVKYRDKYNSSNWKKKIMNCISENIYSCDIEFESCGVYEYTVEVESSAGKRNKKITAVSYDKILEVFVEPELARFGAWYEMFPRSQGKIPGKSGTFKDCIERIPEIKKMGFNVIYLPPIHPVGRTNRKGPNNSLNAGPDDPGCVWSIGNEYGGHKSVNPELGTLDDFKEFVREARYNGIEIALDIALNCSFDHPYIKEHPNWFFYNPDGSIKFAENPPKRYEDTVFLNFYPEDREEMWNELKSIFIFWIQNGVTIFRIDNPHTKPDEFWFWLIREIKKDYPEVIMLSEAFTYYERLELLAKIGFSQSYTYFTWRNTKNEMFEYFDKMVNSYLKDFLRPNYFTNTPDILPKILQEGGRPAFKMRVALAGTVGTSYGIYSGYELCENSAIPGTESYLNSEKYEYKVWDWDRPGNIKDYISVINKIRKENTALHYYDNLIFLKSTDDNVFAYAKKTQDNKNIILVIVNVNPFITANSRITLPLEDFDMKSDEVFEVEELITNKTYIWKGRENYVRLNPQIEPVYIFRVKRLKSAKDVEKIKPIPEENVYRIACENADYFFNLREKAVKNSDVIARKELGKFYFDYVAPKVYTGPDYDFYYASIINDIARKKGFESIISAYISTSGH